MGVSATRSALSSTDSPFSGVLEIKILGPNASKMSRRAMRCMPRWDEARKIACIAGFGSGSSSNNVNPRDHGRRNISLRVRPAMQSGRRHTISRSCNIRVLGLPGGAKIDTIGAIGKTGQSQEANTAKTSGVMQESGCPERLARKVCKSPNSTSMFSGGPIRAGKCNARSMFGAIGGGRVHGA